MSDRDTFTNRVHTIRLRLAPWVVLSLCIVLLTVFVRTELPVNFVGVSTAQVTAALDEEGTSTFTDWWQRIETQVAGVWAETGQVAQLIFNFDRLPNVSRQPVTQLMIDEEVGAELVRTVTRSPRSETTERLQINVPLTVASGLSVGGTANLSTTSVTGPLTVTDTAQMLDLVVTGSSQLNTLQVNSALTADSVTANGLDATNFSSTDATIATLQVTNDTQLSGLLTADAGLVTSGADIDAGEGNVFAANIVNEIIAGDNIVVTGTRNAPVISYEAGDIDMVASLNGESGELELEEGSGIDISGLSIRSIDTLSLVRSRGGCAGCISDTDVSPVLTISGGSINSTNIGATTPATGAFTMLTAATTTISEKLTVSGTATSTFGGSVNLTAGCFAVNGTCIDGSDISYTGLLDTPNALLADSVPFVNSAGDALTQSANFTFDGERLAVGTSTASTTLIVGGSASIGNTLTVDGTATSTFAGSVNLTAGCFAVNGTCLDVGTNSYVGLSDTPNSLISGALQFANAAGTDVDQSSTLVFDGTRLGVGTDTPLTELSVAGDASVLGGQGMRFYDDSNTNFVGFRASSTLPGSLTWTLPPTDGTNNQLLVTDGAGNLRFANVSSIGGGANTYLDLTDTVSSYASSSIPFVNTAGTALTQANDFVYQNNQLGVGLTAPTDTLTVAGSVRFQLTDGQVGMQYNTSNNRFGFGTENPAERVTIQGGSLLQRGGITSAQYIPNLQSSLPLITQANDVAVVGDYAFVVTNQNGNDFHVIDIRNPLAPVEVTGAAIPLPAGATSIAVAGRYAYVTTEVSGDDFHVIDINDPLNPVQVASVGLPTTANAVALQGQYAFVGTDNIGNDFHVINISDPLNPLEVMGAALDIDDSVNGIAVAGQYAYLVSSIQENDFHVIDISDPHNPVEVGWLGLPTTATDVAVVGRYAYVTTNSDGDDFHVIDISNPALPVEVGSLNLDASALGVKVAGRYAYVTTEATGNDLHVIDISDPTTPMEIGGLDLSSGAVQGIDIIGRYAYLVSGLTGSQFHIVDVSGAELQSADIHALDAGLLNVRGDALINGKITASLGLRAGVEGIQTDGIMSVLSTDTSYIAGALSIGTTTSNAKLTVAGTIQATDLYGGAVGLETDANGNIIRAASDERLKTNVSTINGALDNVLQLRGVQYEWIDTDRFGSQTEIGFLAQEVDLVLPEVVRKGGEYWSLNTRNIVAVVVEAIKELWVIVQGNQDELETLRERVERLEGELAGQAATTATAPATTTATDDPPADTSSTTPEADAAESPDQIIATTTITATTTIFDPSLGDFTTSAATPADTVMATTGSSTADMAPAETAPDVAMEENDSASILETGPATTTPDVDVDTVTTSDTTTSTATGLSTTTPDDYPQD